MAEENTWEVCEIKIDERKRGLFSTDWRFIAETTGPSGVGTAALSDQFHTPNRMYRRLGAIAEHQMCGSHLDQSGPCGALREMVNRLIVRGWEPLPPGGAWFSRRFRRRFTPPQEAVE